MILVLDNYDSFTFNLAHYIEETGVPVKVLRNDKTSIKEIKSIIKPSKIIISPGPCTPNEAGICIDVIKEFYNKLPILGVCLGHQAIYEYFGGSLSNLEDVNHGVSTKISIIDSDYIFKDINKQINVGLYHSWVVNKDNLPRCLEITSINQDGFISSFKHKELDVRGVQFHPESILTDYGLKMIENWVRFN